MAKQVWKPSTQLGPLPPALVTCGTVDSPNVLTVAWTGIVNSSPPMTYVSIRPERFSYGLIERSGEFVINLPTAALVRAIDLCGVRSGRDTDKFKLAHLTAEPSQHVAAPRLQESPLALECRVKETFNLGSHTMFLAEILSVDVEEKLLDERGKLRLDKAGLCAFAHGEYFALGRKIGRMGYSVKKRRAKPADRERR
ncbi:flavin reductase family protein [Feifania hominis]|uniref:Flavin reductase family protein n=1 Tax=Feifania hominis TaxID=2763660 RepID=A0A926HQE5_9FIRM|nr:flavin reductase family protein [Feifania hominis]MBC8536252.1 flavin reductase family protein [Feifania hominis]